MSTYWERAREFDSSIPPAECEVAFCPAPARARCLVETPGGNIVACPFCAALVASRNWYACEFATYRRLQFGESWWSRVRHARTRRFQAHDHVMALAERIDWKGALAWASQSS